MESKLFSAAIGSLDPFQQHCNFPTVKKESTDGEQNINNSTQQLVRRGRPSGSRNKQKESSVLYEDSVDAIMPHVVQLQPGADIVQCLRVFYRRLQVGGLYVMSALGRVVDVAICMAGQVRFLRGTCQILSLCGTFLPHCNSLSISVLDSEGSVIAGLVDGILRAAGPVTIVVGSCADPSFHRFRALVDVQFLHSVRPLM